MPIRPTDRGARGAGTPGHHGVVGSSGARRPISVGPAGLSRQTAMLLVLLLAVAVVLAPFFRAWVEQQGRISALKSDIAARQKAVSELEIADKRWQDNNYVITQARKRFTYVMPGEVGYVVLDTPRTVTDEKNPSGAAARQAAISKRSWVSTMWGSVEIAGEAPADPAGVAKP